jgi:hypothetical protein
LIIDAVKSVGQTHVFLYVFGSKSKSPSLISKIDGAALRGGADDNCFHIGKSVLGKDIPLFHVPARNAPGQRTWNFSYLDSYPLFKHLGRNFGALEFRSPSANVNEEKVKIYQLWIHWIKASLHSDFLIPKNKRLACSFKEKYDKLVSDLLRALDHVEMGGYRVEVAAQGDTLSSVITRFAEQCELDFWISRGLRRMDIEPIAVLTAAETALCAAKRLGVFRGDGDCSDREKVVFIDLCNVIGITVPPSFNQLGRYTNTLSPPWQQWQTFHLRQLPVRAPREPDGSRLDRNLMASLLNYRLAIGGGYTLTLREGGGQWDHRWWIGETRAPQDDRYGFFLAMVKMVEKFALGNWKKLFALRSEPRELDFDLNAERYQQEESVVMERLVQQQFAEVQDRLPWNRGGNGAEVESLEDTRRPEDDDPIGELLREESRSPLQSTLVIAEAQRAIEPRQSLSLDWIVRPVSAQMLSLIHSVADTSNDLPQGSDIVWGKRKRTDWDANLDSCMFEYAYQRSRGGNEKYQPGSEGFWEGAKLVGLFPKRGAGTLKNRWRTKLKDKFGDYCARRDSEYNP